jgi:hypothetical protein
MRAGDRARRTGAGHPGPAGGRGVTVGVLFVGAAAIMLGVAAWSGGPAAEDALAATSTTTTTTLPVTACEAFVASRLLGLFTQIAQCHERAVRRTFKGKAFDEEGCEARARGRYDRVARQFQAIGCPRCLADPAASGLAAGAVALAETVGDRVFCVPGTPVPPDSIEAPPDRHTVNCEARVQNRTMRLVKRVVQCVTPQSSPADVVACATNEVNAYVSRVGSCGPCFDAQQTGSTVEGALGTMLPNVFCSCAGRPASACDDKNSCTVDSCDPIEGCQYANAADGTKCAEGNTCTMTPQVVFRPGMCKKGSCTAGPPDNCNDGNACTDDGCDLDAGCTHENNVASCDDGNICTQGDFCSNGKCLGGTPLNCDDGDPNTVDSCVPGKGCIHCPAGNCP